MAGVNETDQLSWNVIAQHSSFVHELNRTASRLGLKGDYEAKFDYFRAIKDNISQHLNPNELKKADQWENLISKTISLKKMFSTVLESPEGVSTYEIKQIQVRFNKLSQALPSLIREYHAHLLKCMERFGYFPKKKDQTFMKN